MADNIFNNTIPGTEEFNRIITGLNKFSSVTENHFLAISERLQHFYSGSKHIFQCASEVTGLLSSSQYQKGIDDLKAVLNIIFNYLSENENKFSNSKNTFSEITKLLGIICSDISEFKKLVKHLEVQAIAVKIESSRLGNDDKGFENLAQNINNLANLIANQTKGFREQSKVLVEIISNSNSKIDGLKTNQQEYSRQILNNTKSSLGSLVEKYEMSSEKAGSIHSETESIHKEISSLVTAVQFHDITRQQIEHVSEVFSELKDKINFEKDEKRLLLYIYKVVRLQSAQLKNSKDELSRAVSDITLNLEGILKNISDISVQISELMRNNESGSNSFIEKVNTGLNNAVAILLKNSDVGNELSDSIEKVVHTIGGLSEFVNEISNIGSEIELISLNASIKAAHTGREGAALGVLAEAIQKLSIEAKGETNSVIGKLVSVREISDALQKSNSENSIKDEDEKLKSVSSDINRIIGFLNSIVTKAVNDLNEIKRAVTNLENDIRKTVRSNNNYLVLEKQITEIIDGLDAIVDECEKYVDKSSADEIKLNEINKKYTMQVQRDIHNSIDGAAGNIPAAELSEDVNKNLSEFGDNVELF